MEKIPTFAVDLIKELDKLYPEKCADPNKSDREIWQYVGARSLVRMLLNKVKDDETDHLNVINVLEKE
jgi:hypothetical protein